MYKSATEMRGVSYERENTGGGRAAMSGGLHDTHTCGRGAWAGERTGPHTYKRTERDETRLRGEIKNKDFFVDGGGDGQNKYKECRSAIQEEARITCRVCNDQSARKVVICGGVGT